MKSFHITTITLGAFAIALTVAQSVHADDVGTAFTYQGELADGGSPVGSPTPVDCDFEFTLWDAATLGSPIGPPLTPTVTVTDGRFTEVLDFGVDAFPGVARWVEIQVCCPSACAPGYVPLTPRQELTPAPHALALPGLHTQQNSTCPNLIGGHSGNSVTPGAVGATIAGGGVYPYTNRVTDAYGTIGGGFGNQAGDDAGTSGDRTFATVGGGSINTASGAYATVPGGNSNLAGGDHSFAAG
jgi:trimeric autotransporter adhesin